MVRWSRRLGVGLLVVVLLAVAGIAVFALTLPRDRVSRLEPEALRVRGGLAGTLTASSLQVTLTDGEDARLRVRREGRVVWESVPGEAFLGAGSGEVDVEEHRGYFWPETDREHRWTAQEVTGFETRGDTVRLDGTLSDGDDEVSWSATLTVRAGGGAVLAAEADDDVDSLLLSSGRSRGAGVHGLGEQFTDFDLSGRLIPLLVREQGVGRGEQPLTVLADLTNRSAAGTELTTYAAWPTFVTDDRRGVRLDPALPESQAFALADTRDPDRVGLEVWAPTLRAELTSGATPAQLVAAQQAGVSRPGLASWTQRGAIVGLQGGTEEVRRTCGRSGGPGVRIAGVWLQDWTGQRTTSFGDRLWWTWQLDRERYPGWESLVRDLRAQGIAVTTYMNPFLVDAAPLENPTIRNLWAEAGDRGFLVRDADGQAYRLDQGGFEASLVDLSNPEARDWYADVVATQVLGVGAVGFMADFGEGLPLDATLHSGSPARLHNAWPRLWARTVREGCRRAGQPDCLVWFRSGSLGMAEDASLSWNGDQMVDFSRQDGVASALLGTFAAGVSGWPLTHSDIGGYTSVDTPVRRYRRSPELLERWAEMEAFGVLMRTHEGNRPDVNAQVYDDSASAKAFARMTRVYAALAPYRRGVVAEAVQTGVPAVRHGWLVVPDSDAAQADTQFFLGSSVLVAPVLSEGDRTVQVTLPPGRWRHLFTGKTYAGDGLRRVPAPLGTPAAFVRTDDPWAERLLAAVRAALKDG